MGPTEADPRRRARLACLVALLGAPAVGYAVARLEGLLTGLACGVALFAAAAAWAALELSRARRGVPRVTWSFAPLSAAIIAATDVLAVAGDTPLTYAVVALPAALLCGAVVFGCELRESRRPLYSALKAAAAAVLVAIPLPVGGLVGAGASLGHRLFVPPPDPAPRGQ